MEKDTCSVKCSNCFKRFDVSNMGESSLASHMKDKKHCERAPYVSGSQSTYFSKGESIDLSGNSCRNLLDIEDCFIKVFKKFLLCSCYIRQLFKVMFWDSKVAESFSCAKPKFRYVITYGLAPYLLQCLPDERKANPYHVMWWKFNWVLHFGQMDLLIRFWQESKKHVTIRYLTSEVL